MYRAVDAQVDNHVVTTLLGKGVGGYAMLTYIYVYIFCGIPTRSWMCIMSARIMHAVPKIAGNTRVMLGKCAC